MEEQSAPTPDPQDPPDEHVEDMMPEQPREGRSPGEGADQGGGGDQVSAGEGDEGVQGGEGLGDAGLSQKLTTEASGRGSGGSSEAGGGAEDEGGEEDPSAEGGEQAATGGREAGASGDGADAPAAPDRAPPEDSEAEERPTEHTAAGHEDEVQGDASAAAPEGSLEAGRCVGSGSDIDDEEKESENSVASGGEDERTGLLEGGVGEQGGWEVQESKAEDGQGACVHESKDEAGQEDEHVPMGVVPQELAQPQDSDRGQEEIEESATAEGEEEAGEGGGGALADCNSPGDSQNAQEFAHEEQGEDGGESEEGQVQGAVEAIRNGGEAAVQEEDPGTRAQGGARSSGQFVTPAPDAGHTSQEVGPEGSVGDRADSRHAGGSGVRGGDAEEVAHPEAGEGEGGGLQSGEGDDDGDGDEDDDEGEAVLEDEDGDEGEAVLEDEEDDEGEAVLEDEDGDEGEAVLEDEEDDEGEAVLEDEDGDEGEAVLEDEEDDHNYEITDFSLATPFERLVRDVEDVLSKWAVSDGRLGSGWDEELDPSKGHSILHATREHTILNTSRTKGVKHRCAHVQYKGSKYILRHIVWLPEGTSAPDLEANNAAYAGLCGVEALWNKRSSAASTSNYVHELGCCLGVANYIIFAPDDSQGHVPRASMQDVTLLRSTLAIAMHNVGCAICGLTPSGPRGTPQAFSDFPYTFHGFQAHHGKTTRLCCYLDAQASRETADSMKTPHGAVQYMLARHCFPGDSVCISVRDTHYLVINNRSTSNRPTHTEWRRGVQARATPSASDFEWGAGSEPMEKLTLELTWAGVRGGSVPRGDVGEAAKGVRCGLPLSEASDWYVACQFIDDLPCPLAEALERLCGVYVKAQSVSSFAEVWEVDDPIRHMLKRGLALKERPPPTVESLQIALEDMLPSDPEGYTVSGQCVAVHTPSASEAQAMKELRIRAAPPGGLLALLAKHLSEERVSSNLRYVALLWSEFVNEVRWFWDQGIRIPRMPVDGEEIDRGCCLIHQKLQVLNICIRKKAQAKTDPCVDNAHEEFDLNLIREAEVSTLLMVGIPPATPEPSDSGEGDESPRHAHAGGEAASSSRKPSGDAVAHASEGDSNVAERAPIQGGAPQSGPKNLETSPRSPGEGEGGDLFHDAFDQPLAPSSVGSSAPPSPSKEGRNRSSHGSAGRRDAAGTSTPGSKGSVSPGSTDSYEVPDTQIGSEHGCEGVKGNLKGMNLLVTGEPMNEPITQEHPVLTDDRVEEQELMMLNVGTGSRAVFLRAKLSGGLRALKSDMAAFQAANPGCCLEDFVRWYSPRDWQPIEEVATDVVGVVLGGVMPTHGHVQARSRGRLSVRFSQPGNTWLECWRSVVPMPAHKQKKLFDYVNEAERTLHDLQNVTPADLALQIVNCGFMAASHTLMATQTAPEVESVANTLARVRHLLWCSDDSMRGVDKEHLEDICTAFGLAEQQVTKATSLLSKFGYGVSGLVNQLCTTGRAKLTTEEQRIAVTKLAGGDADAEEAPSLRTPQVREYVCTASGGKKGCDQQLFVRSEPTLFRIATSTTAPTL